MGKDGMLTEIAPSLMPETLPAVRSKKDGISRILYTPVLPIVGRKNKDGPMDSPQGLPLPKKAFQNPFRLFTESDIVLLLIVNALTCAVSYGVITSIPTLFEQTYDFLDETKVGLCFLAIGGGMAIGSAVSGKLLDKWFVKEKRRFVENLSTDSLVDTKSVDIYPEFPLERVSLLCLVVQTLLILLIYQGPLIFYSFPGHHLRSLHSWLRVGTREACQYCCTSYPPHNQ